MPRISKKKPGSPDIWPDDIHNYVNLGSSLPESKKYGILFRLWKPESDYSFPGLAYSAAKNGSFCINCVLFGGESTHNISKLTSALPSSASDFQKLCQHSEKSNAQAMARVSRFYSVYECALRRGFVH